MNPIVHAFAFCLPVIYMNEWRVLLGAPSKNVGTPSSLCEMIKIPLFFKSICAPAARLFLFFSAFLLFCSVSLVHLLPRFSRLLFRFAASSEVVVLLFTIVDGVVVMLSFFFFVGASLLRKAFRAFCFCASIVVRYRASIVCVFFVVCRWSLTMKTWSAFEFCAAGYMRIKLNMYIMLAKILLVVDVWWELLTIFLVHASYLDMFLVSYHLRQFICFGGDLVFLTKDYLNTKWA